MRLVGLDIQLLARMDELGLSLKSMIELDCPKRDIFKEWDADIEYIETVTEFEQINPLPYLFQYIKVATHGINGGRI